MQVRIWGARGSYPASGAAFAAFGHHTACISVTLGDDMIVLDAGSGAGALGVALAQRPVRRLHVLLSHFHHDHLTGLPFLLNGARGCDAFAIHGQPPAGEGLEALIGRMFSAPYFPDEAGEILGRVAFHAHQPGDAFTIGSAAIATAPLDHPGGSTAYRLEAAGKSLCYATDVEVSLTPAAPLLALAAGADLLIHDTMFTAEESATRRGWGHSTIEAAVALARLAGVRQLAGFHHSPLHDDATLEARQVMLARLLPGAHLAHEGQEYPL